MNLKRVICLIAPLVLILFSAFSCNAPVIAADTVAPLCAQYNPADEATEVSASADIAIHITDGGSGVDQSSIVMKVDDTAVTPIITGTEEDYTITYNPPADFGYLEQVDVTIDAADLDGNVMATNAYSFTTAPAAIVIPSQITDDLGRIIDIDGAPEKIVSLAPSNTEILFALGLGDSVVGVSDFCNYPQEVNTRSALADGNAGKIARVGNAFAVNIEAIAALEPDMVMVFGYNLPTYVEQLETLGLTVIVLGPESIEDILANIELVGSITGLGQEAKELTDQLKADLAIITAETALVSRPTVFCETGYGGGIWTTGSGSFVSNLIMLAGGTDIGVGVSKNNPNISLEYLVAADSEMIILADAPWVTASDVKARGGAWNDLSAVQNDKIYDIDADVISRNGPRVVEGIMALLEIIHPDIYAELQE